MPFNSADRFATSDEDTREAASGFAFIIKAESLFLTSKPMSFYRWPVLEIFQDN
jgi:hypothetical protein